MFSPSSLSPPLLSLPPSSLSPSPPLLSLPLLPPLPPYFPLAEDLIVLCTPSSQPTKLRPQIRAATFSLVSTVCRQLQELVQSNTKQFCSTVLGSLGESEPVVIGSLWEATLQVVEQSEVQIRHSSLVPRPHPLTRRNGLVKSSRISWASIHFCNSVT